MTSDSRVEAVARAICQSNGDDAEDTRMFPPDKPVWTRYIADAQAAIEASDAWLFLRIEDWPQAVREGIEDALNPPTEEPDQ